MKKYIFFISLLASQIVLFGAISEAIPDLSGRYSQLEDFYSKADKALCKCSLKPLTDFSQEYGGCYWIVKSTSGDYYGDNFIIGTATYTITTDGSQGEPGNGPLFPPTPPTSGVVQTQPGAAIVFGETFAYDNEVNLDNLGAVNFPTAVHSDSENALAITIKTNLPGVGPATEVDYLRKYSKDGSVALKQTFTAVGKTSTGYGYCWKQSAQKPR